MTLNLKQENAYGFVTWEYLKQSLHLFEKKRDQDVPGSLLLGDIVNNAVGLCIA